MEAIGREARNTVMQAEMKRRSFKGVIDVVYGGDKSERVTDYPGKNGKAKFGKSHKRKADTLDRVAEEDAFIQAKPMSKREQKRQAKKARLEKDQGQDKNANGSLGTLPAPESNPISTNSKSIENIAESRSDV